MPATHAESFRTVKSRDGSGLGRSTTRVLPLRRAFGGAALAALEALEAFAEPPAADRDDDLDRVCGAILGFDSGVNFRETAHKFLLVFFRRSKDTRDPGTLFYTK